MARRQGFTILPPSPKAEPEYDLYEELRHDAELRSRRQLGGGLRCMTDVAAKRGYDWCTAVLGRSFPGMDRVSSVDGWMLVAADELNLDPPLPRRIVDEREAERQRRESQALLHKAKLEAATRRWNLVAVGSPVVLTVRENTRHSGPDGEHLRHVVPPVDVVSGKARKHAADMGLCEVPAKADPLHLGDPVDLPPNCQRCLDYAPKIRDKDAPAPPTAAEATLMRLIASGAVFTLRPARSQPTIRDTSQHSRGTRGGALGRKVDVRVKALQVKGWAAPDSHYSETQTGHRGHLWRLTPAGTTALEG